MRRTLEQQVLEHTNTERLRLVHSAQALILRVQADHHIPLGYRDVLMNVLRALILTMEGSQDVGHWRASTDCWNSLAQQVNGRFPLDVPLQRIEPPHPEV